METMMAESSAGDIELGLKMQTMTVEQPEEKSKEEFTIPFKHFKSYTIPFSKVDICKDEKLSEVWKTDVEEVFASHGLSCTLKWNEGVVTMAETENTCYAQVVDKGLHALVAITCGLRAEWVEPIVSGTVASDLFILWTPVGMNEEEFSRKYDEFIHKVEDEFVLARELFSQVLYKRCVWFSYYLGYE